MKGPCKITDAIHGAITLSGYERSIMATEAFNRLHDVYQNSVVYLTFPCNREKRFEHSIGTLDVCSRMFVCSIRNTPQDTLANFFKEFSREVQRAKERIFFSGEPHRERKMGATLKNCEPKPDDFILSLVPANVAGKYRITCAILLQSVRVAAMLHDIGHPPFSHVVESSLSDLYKDSRDKGDKVAWHEYQKLMEPYFSDKKKLHEEMGNAICNAVLLQSIPSLPDGERDSHPESLYLMMVRECTCMILSEDGSFAYLHRIVDSCVDGDRLDYVSRDPRSSGFDIGFVNYERIISGMRIIQIEQDAGGPISDQFVFSFPVKAVGSIEDFLQRRFDLYRDIVFHHRSVLMDHLLRQCVRDLAALELDEESEKHDRQGSKEDFRFESSQTSLSIPMEIKGLWYPLQASQTLAEKSRGLSQWNDSWLTTVLRHNYYCKFYLKQNQNNTTKKRLGTRLAELLDNEKAHYSLVKRCESFRVLDCAAKKSVLDLSGELQERLAVAKKRANAMKHSAEDTRYHPTDESSIDSAYSMPLGATLDAIDELLRVCATRKEMLYPAFMKMANAFRKLTDGIPDPSIDGSRVKTEDARVVAEEALAPIVSEAVENALSKDRRGHDVIVDFSRPNDGLGVGEVVLHDELGTIYLLGEVSSIRDRLQLQADYMPGFWVYAWLDDDSRNFQTRRRLLESAGCAFGKFVVECIMSELLIAEPQAKNIK